MASSSVGVARLDLVRPGLLDVEAYDRRNILFTRPGAYRRGPGRPPTTTRSVGGGLTGGFLTVGGGVDGRRGAQAARRVARAEVPAYVLDTAGGGAARGRGRGGYDDDDGGGGGDHASSSSPLPTGARFKLMRCWQLRPRGNDLEGARKVDEAAAAQSQMRSHAAASSGGAWAWPGRWRRRRGGGGGAAAASSEPLQLLQADDKEDDGDENNKPRRRRGLELVSNTPAAGAAELFGERGDDGARLILDDNDGGGNSDGNGNSHHRPAAYYSLRAPRPLLDFGLGASLNLDRSRLEPVARLKVAGLVSFHLTPRPRLKVARVWRLPGTAMALRLRYECPLTADCLSSPWQPPARLLLRMDNGVGSGVHLSPGGLELDERRVALGDNLALRAAATVLFPRSLPMPRGEDALRVRINRLSVKTLW
jgi:hypothetical protein